MMETENQELELSTNEKAAPKPALVINIHTWATPIIGLVMLAVGLAGGYFGRPLISPSEATPTVATTASTSDTQESLPVAAATTSPEEQASRQEMMDFIISQTRHFQGDPEATVTIVEFSDFQ
ncbi:MAG: hypothetical protein JSV61_11800 [Anaerolineales bacterium]|nr:MAG: hypothetical protein JSV61_11800 [Anaerolineales bacterium]